ncbi:MAG TPA: hypothetical protein VK530_16010 [Candidatus Acidoferrum sp.]|nr:hypothetical protein [Candidatus Acidoferrum sp.]
MVLQKKIVKAGRLFVGPGSSPALPEKLRATFLKRGEIWHDAAGKSLQIKSKLHQSSFDFALRGLDEILIPHRGRFGVSTIDPRPHVVAPASETGFLPDQLFQAPLEFFSLGCQ